MPLKRYQQIRRFLHFVDNNVQDSDRYYKDRPLVQKIRDNCLAQENERRFSIDGMMIPYKGTKAGKRRQYMKDKPNKWGFKNYVRAGVSGMIYNFVLYGEEDTFRFHSFTERNQSDLERKSLLLCAKVLNPNQSLFFVITFLVAWNCSTY